MQQRHETELVDVVEVMPCQERRCRDRAELLVHERHDAHTGGPLTRADADRDLLQAAVEVTGRSEALRRTSTPG